MADDPPELNDDDEDLRPKTFLEKKEYELVVAAVAAALFSVGLIFG